MSAPDDDLLQQESQDELLQLQSLKVYGESALFDPPISQSYKDAQCLYGIEQFSLKDAKGKLVDLLRIAEANYLGSYDVEHWFEFKRGWVQVLSCSAEWSPYYRTGKSLCTVIARVTDHPDVQKPKSAYGILEDMCQECNLQPLYVSDLLARYGKFFIEQLKGMGLDKTSFAKHVSAGSLEELALSLTPSPPRQIAQAHLNLHTFHHIKQVRRSPFAYKCPLAECGEIITDTFSNTMQDAVRQHQQLHLASDDHANDMLAPGASTASPRMPALGMITGMQLWQTERYLDRLQRNVSEAFKKDLIPSAAMTRRLAMIAERAQRKQGQPPIKQATSARFNIIKSIIATPPPKPIIFSATAIVSTPTVARVPTLGLDELSDLMRSVLKRAHGRRLTVSGIVAKIAAERPAFHKQQDAAKMVSTLLHTSHEFKMELDCSVQYWRHIPPPVAATQFSPIAQPNRKVDEIYLLSSTPVAPAKPPKAELPPSPTSDGTLPALSTPSSAADLAHSPAVYLLDDAPRASAKRRKARSSAFRESVKAKRSKRSSQPRSPSPEVVYLPSHVDQAFVVSDGSDVEEVFILPSSKAAPRSSARPPRRDRTPSPEPNPAAQRTKKTALPPQPPPPPSTTLHVPAPPAASSAPPAKRHKASAMSPPTSTTAPTSSNHNSAAPLSHASALAPAPAAPAPTTTTTTQTPSTSTVPARDINPLRFKGFNATSWIQPAMSMLNRDLDLLIRRSENLKKSSQRTLALYWHFGFGVSEFGWFLSTTARSSLRRFPNIPVTTVNKEARAATMGAKPQCTTIVISDSE
ncbi:hypothetical protein RI367_000329 [Sorochytrium milnesiophthora]